MISFLDYNFKFIWFEFLLISFSLILVLLSCYKYWSVINWKGKQFKYNSSILNINLLIILCFFICFLSIFLFKGNFSFFANQLKTNDLICFFKILLLISSIFILFISKRFLIEENKQSSEFSLLYILLIIGVSIIFSSNDFLMLFLGIELISLTFYVLAGLDNKTNYNSEAAIKYFIIGAIASGLLVFGISLIFNASGSINLSEIKILLLYSNEYLTDIVKNQIIMGLIFIIIGLFIKLAAAPFHMWAPDVYEGVPLHIMLIYMIIPKISFIYILINIYIYIFIYFPFIWTFLCITSGLLSVIWGTFAAIGQQKIKRLLAYSSITHVGFMLLGLSNISVKSLSIVIFYLFIYVITTLGIMSYIINLKCRNGNQITTISQLKFIFPRYKTMSYLFSSLIFSIAGIPPLAGFFAKLLIINELVINNFANISVIILLISALGSFYYIRLIKNLIFRSPNEKNNLLLINAPSKPQIYILSLSFIVNLLFFFVPWIFIDFIQYILYNSISLI